MSPLSTYTDVSTLRQRRQVYPPVTEHVGLGLGLGPKCPEGTRPGWSGHNNVRGRVVEETRSMCLSGTSIDEDENDHEREDDH